MQRSLQTIITFLLLSGGCGQHAPEEPASTSIVNDQGELTVELPPLIPEPNVELRFSDSQRVASWQNETILIIEGLSTVTHPRDIWPYALEFQVDHANPINVAAQRQVWNATWSAYPAGDYDMDSDMPPVEEARLLEANDQEWGAAEIYFAHNMIEDAKRCGRKLEEEGEWKVVAMTAVLTGDLEVLTRATTRMVEDDQISRTQDVITYAVQMQKLNAAQHICDTHGWEFSEILNDDGRRMLAIAGDPSYMPEIIEREFAGDPNLVADIVLLSRSNPELAKEYATRLLQTPQANLFVWGHCGEGCYHDPVRGSIELYQLISGDAELVQLYFQRMTDWFNEVYPIVPQDEEALENYEWPQKQIWGEQEMFQGFGTDMWGTDNFGPHSVNLLHTHLWDVRQTGDARLIGWWTKMLDSFPERSSYMAERGFLSFDREYGRYVLGLPVSTDTPGLSPSQQIAVATLQGKSVPDMSGVWTMLEEEPTDSEIYGVKWLFAFLTRGTVMPVREEEIREELNLSFTDTGFISGLRYDLRQLFSDAMEAHLKLDYRLKWRLDDPQKDYETNAFAQIERERLGLPPIDLYPDTQEELDELMAPMLTALKDKLPGQYALWQMSQTTTP